jgi:DNA-binding MarR family transcriptional regulator
MASKQTRADTIPLIVADLYELAGAFRDRGEAMARTLGQTQARWQVLSAISGDHPLSVPQVARRLGISRQAVQRIADILAGEGLAKFVANPDHQSSPHLVPTESGSAAFAQLMRNARASHEKLARELDGVDLDRLRGDLRALLQVLNGPRKFKRGA